MKAKKGKIVKKISVFAALSALICMTLGISVFAEETPLVKGSVCYIQGDVNSDGEVSEDDALYLLYHSIYPEDYPIVQDGNLDQDEANMISVKDAYYLLDKVGDSEFATTVHAYNEPVWTWGKTDAGEVTATATYHCACGKSETTPVRYATVEKDVKDPTCIEAGRVTYTAKVEFMGETDTASKVVDTVAIGHVFAEDTNACADRTCTVCDYVEKAEAHTYELTKGTAATCTDAATETYTCSVCGDTYTNEVGKAAGHKLGTEVVSWVLVEGETCKYNPVYECTTCENEIAVQLDADKVAVRHEYEVVGTVEPQCTTAGYTEYKCSVCNDVYKVEIPANDNAHTWDDGETADGITTYHCENANCDAEKTTINAKAEKETTVSSDVLAEVGEVEVNNTSIKLDKETLGDLTGDVEIAAGEADKKDLNISDEIASQIGNNPVYDFSITADGEKVSEFSGEITISLPYTLGEGEDADLIDVWFIAEDGTVTSQKGTYSNGFVTFTTDHFSYYTVTRLTPAQRCEKYGHSETARVIAPTCEEDGYTLHVCVRCGATWEDTIVDALGHELVVDETAATCTKAGSKKETCEREGCKYKRTTTIPALGHDWEVSETKETSCSAPGYEKSECANCGETKEKVIAQLAHDLATTVVDATCETKGYTVHACKDCDYEEIEDETAATGHTYEATWTWDKENISAVLTLTCTTEGCDSVVTKDAVITSKEIKATCKAAGSITYTAKVVYNGETYSNFYEIELPKLEHSISTEWKYDAVKHYHECTVCKEKVDISDHAMSDAVVDNEPTCTEEGTKVSSCECGYKKTEAVAALGHEFVDGVCTRCEYKANTCAHDEFTVYEVELGTENGMCAGIVAYETCDCGEVAYFYGYDLGCDMEYDYTSSVDEQGYVTYHLEMNCTECGASVVIDENWEVDDNCAGTLYMDMTICNAEDTVVFDFQGIEAEDIEHPPIIYTETLDLADYGFCGGTLINTSCDCGDTKSFILNTDCDFVAIPEECGEGKYVSACPDCGIKIVNTWGVKDLGNCEGHYEDLYICYKDGVEVLRYEDSCDVVDHAYEYTFDLDVDGGTCSDGYTVYVTCTKCGMERSHHDAALEGEHDIFWKSVDVSEYELCIDEMYMYYCPCGEESWSNIDYDCDFSWYGYDEFETDNGWMYVDTGVCDYCGLTVEEEVCFNYTENPCIMEVDRTYVYSKDGKEIYTVHNTGMVDDHNSIAVDYVLEGTSCEDGVVITYECQDCGEVYEDYIYWHRDMLFESHDLEEYGMCGGTVEVYGCACGEYYEYWEDSECNWQHYYYDETTDTDIQKCFECGMFRSDNYTETELEGCMVVETSRRTYFNDVETVLVVEVTRNVENHDFAYIYELDGDVCSDGYTVFAVCEKCGVESFWYEQPYEGEHYTYEVEDVDFAEYGFCGGNIRKYACPCGEEAGYNWTWNACDFEWYDNMDDGTTWYQCQDCGSYYSYVSEFVSEEGCYENYLVTYAFYDADLKEVYSFERTETYSNHNSVYSFNIAEGAVCSDGFEVTEICQNCDYSSTRYSKPSEGNHYTYVVERVNLEDYGFCGGDVVRNRCACGEYDHYARWYSNCYFSYDYYDEETQMNHYTCVTCGGSYVYGYNEREVDVCHDAYDYTYVYYTPEGEVAFTYEYTSMGESHDYTYTFKLYGDSCADGYTIYGDCKNCDATYESYSVYHNGYVTDSFDFGEAGYCGGYMEVYACPCGEADGYNNYMSCSWSYDSYDEETGTTTYVCDYCDLIRKSTEIYGEKDENCRQQVNRHYAYLDEDEKVIFEFDDSYWTTNHNSYYDFNMLGESCEDGYYLISKCKDCDYSYEENYLRNYHSTWTVDSIDAGALGFCEGTLRHEKCPCGKYDNYYLYTDCYFDYDYDTETYVCEDCGVVQEETDEVIEVDECNTRYDYNYIYTKDGEVILEYTNSHYGEHHTGEYEFVFNDEEAGCEGGYTGTGTCKDCGKALTTSGSWHNIYLVEEYDLAEYGACEGAAIRYSACACGERHDLSSYLYGYCDIAYTSNAFTDEAGIVHNVEQRTCRECGLIFKQDKVTTLNTEDCTRTITNTVTIAVGTTAVDQFTYVVTEEYHDTEATAELLDGAVDCNDGVEVTYNCKHCDYSYSNTYYWHYEVELARYDLSEFGSVCGGYLVHQACPCDYYNSFSFEDMECDLDTDWGYDLAWLGESYDGQETTQGWFYPDVYGYKYTCAVTDPQCSFAARRCYYYEWDKENCAMTRYEVWQLGCEYDSEGNFVSCQEEIKFEGSTRAYHDYAAETVTEGNRTTTIETCSQCGSTHTYSSEYSNTGYTLYYEDTCVNKLDNGENKFRSEIREYVMYSDYSFPVKDYYAVTYADGEEYWHNYDYTYDFDNFDCTRTCHYTDSYGNDETYEEDCHPVYDCEYDTIKESTCSQFGEVHHYHACILCGELDYDQTYETSPNEHWWLYDDEIGMYTCYYCGLQNTNGADGTIVVEDLTEAYGEDTDFVVGYWNRSEVQFVYNLSVILGEEYDIVLNGIEFTELTRDVNGITAITFNQQAAKEAAIAALEAAGCTDTTGYELRFAFVPLSSDSDFDYAITFTAEDLAE